MSVPKYSALSHKDSTGEQVDAFGVPYVEILNGRGLASLTVEIVRTLHPASGLLDTDAKPAPGPGIGAMLHEMELNRIAGVLGIPRKTT